MREVVLYKKDGIITNKAALDKFLASLNGEKFLLTAKNIKRRSLNQNAFYWSCLVPLMQQGLYDAGWDDIKDVNDAHEWMKEEFLKVPMVNKLTGETKYKPGSTAKLTTMEFSAFIDAAIKFAAEYLNVQIPYPNEPMVMFAEYDNDKNLIIVE